MNRLLRSTFDPLPRSLSTPGLVALVLVVVLGTAVTVHRYMESSSNPRAVVYGHGATPASGARFEMNGASDRSRAHSLGTRRSGIACESSGSGGGCTRSTSTDEPASPAPSVYEPQ